MAHTEMAVGGLIDLLSGCGRSAPVRQYVDENGRRVVYPAEGRDVDTQFGHLPPEVAVTLT
ncbi:hypothetical protein [Streptomyces sp. NPDC056987]|uniref:hypothetical protein n=1 Tax=Streptomyces sp. NPDC056987 TaxID=3345988 RepID=UPI003645F4B2